MKRLFTPARIYPLLLVTLCLFIAFKNYTPGTFLSGWDTLHPEFDFSLNFKRLLFGVWRTEQGLGAAAGHSHMADLPRVFLLWLFHFIFPLSFLRYSYIFLCLILGPLGFYFLLNYFLSTQKSRFPRLIAFLSALVYLLNLSTVQQFYVPFEMFPTQWALLPWIILFTLQFLSTRTRRPLILFSLATLLAAPQAYAAHLWYPFFGTYLIFLLIYYLVIRIPVKLPVILISLTLLLNSFWLLPNLYYVFTSSHIPKQNKTNRLHSQEFLLKNRETGTVADAALVAGFYFNWDIFNFDLGRSQNLMPSWNNHLKFSDVRLIGFYIFNLSLIGIVLTLYQKQRSTYYFLPFFFLPLILLANRTFPFKPIFDLLLKIPLLQETLRFVFTKASILFTFGLSLYFAFFLSILFDLIPRLRFIRSASLMIVISLLVYVFPIFQGQLISPLVRINYPDSYFQFWQFMASQPQGKILSLPIHEPSGWQYYNWGYQGSGFIWFGLPQSIFDRDFDRWESANEESYREFFYSLYGNNPPLFINTLRKYSVNYILWDQNLISTSQKNPNQITFRYEISWLLDQLQQQGLITPINQFGRLSLYRTNFDNSLINLVTAPPNILPTYHWSYPDLQYPASDYVSQLLYTSIYYPFRDLLTPEDKIDPHKISITSSSDGWRLQFSPSPGNLYYPTDLSQIQPRITAAVSLDSLDTVNDTVQLSFNFPLPSEIQFQLTRQFTVPVTSSVITINGNTLNLPNSPAFLGFIGINVAGNNDVDGRLIDFGFTTLQIPASFDTSSILLPSRQYTAIDIASLSPPSAGVSLQKTNYLTYQTDDVTHGTLIDDPLLPHNSGYIIGVQSQYVSGIPLRFCLKNTYSNICTIEEELSRDSKLHWDYFLVPPTDQGKGFQLKLNAISYGQANTLTQVKSMVVMPIAYRLLSQISTSPDLITAPISQPLNSQIIFPNASLIKTDLPATNSGNSYLTLNQSYSNSWLAFYFKGLKPVFLPNHVLINNWANGWQLPSNLSNLESKIYIIFWPQLLEFLGLALLVPTFLLVLRRR